MNGKLIQGLGLLALVAAIALFGCGDNGASTNDKPANNDKAGGDGSGADGAAKNFAVDFAAARSPARLELKDRAEHGTPPLVDLVPADAVLYLGWRGADDLGPGYDQSHLKAVLDASNAPQLFTQFLPALAQRIGREEQQAAAIMNMVMSVGAKVWRYPTALYVGKMRFTPRGPEEPRIALLCKAGGDAAALTQQFNDMFQKIEAPLRAGESGGVVTVSMGPMPDGDKLASNATFTNTLKQVRGGQALVAYLDAEALFAMIHEGVAAADEREAIDIWTTARDVLGLDGLKRIAFSAGLNGKDWSNHMYIEAPSPRKGLLSLLDGKPISDEALKAVPKHAAWAMAFRLDIARLIADVRGAVGRFDPRMQEEFDEGLRELNNMLGMDIEKDLLQPLGDEWVIYADNTVAGAGMLGIVVVNRLRDGQRFNDGLIKLQTAVQRMIDSETDEDMTIRFRQAKLAGAQVHFLSVPVVSPSWTVQGDALVAGLYPQVVVGALGQLQSGESILDNDKFKAVRNRVAPGRAVNSITYFDLPQTAGEGYQIVLLMSQIYLGLADMFGVESPPMVIPPLHTLAAHLTASGGASWTDDHGWHAMSVSPFPGAEMLGGSQGSVIVAQAAMMAGIMLPAMGQARTTARQMQSAAQLRGILQACQVYADENQGSLPPDLGSLVVDQYIEADTLISPDNARAFSDIGRIRQDGAALNAASDYCYVPTGKLSSIQRPSQHVLVFERLRSPTARGVNVGFADSHVEFLPVGRADGLIRRQTGRSLAEWSQAPNPGAGGK